MNKYHSVLIVILVIAFCCFGVLFSKMKLDEEKEISKEDAKIENTTAENVRNNPDTNISGMHEIEGILDDSSEKLVLITFKYGDIDIYTTEKKLKELRKILGSKISIKGNVEKNNNNLEIKLESYQKIAGISDDEIKDNNDSDATSDTDDDPDENSDLDPSDQDVDVSDSDD